MIEVVDLYKYFGSLQVGSTFPGTAAPEVSYPGRSVESGSSSSTTPGSEQAAW